MPPESPPSTPGRRPSAAASPPSSSPRTAAATGSRPASHASRTCPSCSPCSVPPPTFAPHTISLAAHRIAVIESATRDLRFRDAAGDLDPRPGGLQLVFCDVSTPHAGWNAYDELRSRLANLGIPAERIRFIHDAADDRAKAE